MPERMPLGGALGEVRHVARGTTDLHLDLRSRALGLVGVTLVVDLIAGVLAFLLERGQPGSGIENFWQGLFWTTTQLLTVSSQLRNPISTWAHILDVFLEAYAITVVAALAGSFAAFFHGRTQDRREAEAGPAA